MKYIIVDPNQKSAGDLRRLLEGFEVLDFKGSFTTLESAERFASKMVPDMAFIRMGDPSLNSYQLAGVIRLLNPFSKLIFLGREKAYAVDAFEYEAYGFLLEPYTKEQMTQLLLKKGYEKIPDTSS